MTTKYITTFARGALVVRPANALTPEQKWRADRKQEAAEAARRKLAYQQELASRLAWADNYEEFEKEVFDQQMEEAKRQLGEVQQ